MDVTFRESKPFYGDTSDLADLFQVLDQPQLVNAQEGERTENGNTQQDDQQQQQQIPIVAEIPTVLDRPVSQEHVERPTPPQRWQQNPLVYSRRKGPGEQQDLSQGEQANEHEQDLGQAEQPIEVQHEQQKSTSVDSFEGVNLRPHQTIHWTCQLQSEKEYEKLTQ
jgi:hypothetical protein